jgi:hypothetical protein
MSEKKVVVPVGGTDDVRRERESTDPGSVPERSVPDNAGLGTDWNAALG